MTAFETTSCTRDGVEMVGFLARPAGGKGPHPTVILFPIAGGTGPTFESSVRALAERGYLTVAASDHAGAQTSRRRKAPARLTWAYWNDPNCCARVVECLKHVCAMDEADEDHLAATGYCFGGKCLLELARSGADLKCVVSYHGILPTHAPAQKGASSPRWSRSARAAIPSRRWTITSPSRPSCARPSWSTSSPCSATPGIPSPNRTTKASHRTSPMIRNTSW
ncbi:MAG: hypothetical protein FJX31_08190 [Alphaproteobacteria bacterium]|nr:hypothetical protein [Alphaproteobacteria bacterium]